MNTHTQARTYRPHHIIPHTYTHTHKLRLRAHQLYSYTYKLDSPSDKTHVDVNSNRTNKHVPMTIRCANMITFTDFPFQS